jgi:hypothetical protein
MKSDGLERAEGLLLGLGEWRPSVDLDRDGRILSSRVFAPGLREPELGDFVLAAGELVTIVGRGVIDVEALEALEGFDVLFLLILALGQVILAAFSPSVSLASLRDPGKLWLGLGELALAEQLGRALKFTVGGWLGRCQIRLADGRLRFLRGFIGDETCARLSAMTVPTLKNRIAALRAIR